jgi:hypothetical protein
MLSNIGLQLRNKVEALKIGPKTTALIGNPFRSSDGLSIFEPPIGI